MILFLSIFLSGCFGNSNSPNSQDYGEDFSFTLINGESAKTSDYQGKILLIDFFGINCGYCVPQMFYLEEIYDNYHDKNVEILSIDVWVISGDDIETIEDLLSAYRCSTPCDAESRFSYLNIPYYKDYFSKQDGLELKWDIGLDDSSGTIYYKYANAGIPQLYILDENGNIYYSKSGLTSYSALSEKLDELV